MKSLPILAGIVMSLPILTATAQITNITDQTSTPLPNVGHDYIKLVSETVNPANGSLNLSFAIPTPPHGVGPALPVGVTYNSNSVTTLNPLTGHAGSIALTTSTTPAIGGLSIAGWSVLEPHMTAMGSAKSVTTGYTTNTCPYFANFMYFDRSGTPHALDISQVGSGTGCNQMSSPPTTVSSGSDGLVLASLTSFNNVLITEQDGTQLTFDLPSGLTSGVPVGAFASTITDPHGNEAVSTFSSNGTISVLPTSVTVNGIANSYGLSWASSGGSTGSWSPGFQQALSDGSAVCNPTNQASAYSLGLGSLTLPNGQAYQIQYNPTYGTISKLTYPSGATVTYTWTINTKGNVANWADSLGSTALGCVYTYGTPVVSTRVVSFDGVHSALEQDFTYTTTWDSSTPYTWDTKTTTVVTKDCARASSCTAAPSYKTVYTYTPCNPLACAPNTNDPNSAAGYLAPLIPLESQIQYYDWSGALLKTVNKQWYGATALKSVQTTLPSPSNLVSLTTYPGWCAPSVPLEQDDYDWKVGTPGSLIRRKVLTQSTGYTGRLAIACIPSSAATYNGSGALVAQTNYLHDTYGDLTSETQCVLQANGSCATSSPATTYTYDSTGLLLSKIAPCGNTSCADLTLGSSGTQTTSYTYTSAPAGNVSGAASIAYLTKVSLPVTASGITASRQYAYNYVDGQLIQETDENQNAIKYTYNSPSSNCAYPDGMDRLSEVDYPDGGKVTYCYHDGTYTSGGSFPSTIISTLLNSTVTKTTTDVSDGIGHTVQTQLNSDPAGITTANTTYDGMGNVYIAGNPFRTTSDLTYGSSTNVYDAMGRRTSLTNADGSVETWSYPGNTVIFQNENGSQWNRASDALGRLTAVLEPNGSTSTPTMETDYTYDPLGNLTNVAQYGGPVGTQGAILRSFVYDSLSRLTSATNPESGVVAYSYDANGNVQTKTSSAVNVSSGTQTITYGYDAWNRLLSKSYPSGTSFGCYQYDTSSFASSGSNSIGRLTNTWTQASTCSAAPAASGTLARKSILAYDAMGRVLTEQQCSFTNCTSGVPYTPTYDYDLAGDVIHHSNGIGTMTFTNAYSADGRLLSIGSSVTQYPSILFGSPAYSPLGGLTVATLGNGLTLSRTYDSRFRINSETDIGNSVSSPTLGAATITITGTDQTH